MKYKYNIPALLLASLVFISGNGIAAFEHICNSSKIHSFSFFSSPSCENEMPLSPCCEKMGFKKKKNCCTHKEFFSKLSVEGFIAKQLQLKPIEKVNLDFSSIILFQYSQQILENYYSGLPPPDNLYQIKSFLQPSSVKLQVFRC